MKATGLTRHRFWGEYSAYILLKFESRDDSLRAMPILNDGIDFGSFYNTGGGYTESKGWYALEYAQGDSAMVLFLEVAEPALSKVVERLVSFGAEEKKILSLANSIDHGEQFKIEIA